MKKLRLDLDSIRVASFDTDGGMGRTQGTVLGNSATTATDLFTAACPPPPPPGGGGFGSVGCPLLPPQPRDPNDRYRLRQDGGQ